MRPGVRHLNIYVYTGKPAEHFVRDNKHIVESIKHMSCPITEHVVCNDTTCCVQSQNMWCAITQQVVCTQSTGNAHSSRTAGTAACSHLVKFHLQGRALDSRQPGPQNVRSQHSALDPAIASQPAEAAARHTHTHTHSLAIRRHLLLFWHNTCCVNAQQMLCACCVNAQHMSCAHKHRHCGGYRATLMTRPD